MMRAGKLLVPVLALAAAGGCTPRSGSPGDEHAGTPPAESTMPMGRSTPAGGDMPMGGMGGMMGQGAPGEAPAARAASADSAGGCPPVTQARTDEGRTVFGGTGNCYTCHGSQAKGTALAPDLTDGQWLDVDGSYASIAPLVRAGVPQPKQYPAPMPPKGGASLTDAQVCAVSAYVFSLSH